MAFDISRFKRKSEPTSRYERRVAELQSKRIATDCIDHAVIKAVENIKTKNARSFVIYGEPQSGKTEMMIALTAKLLDDGYRVIVHLLNDSVQLLDQNLDRFKRSGLAPSPKAFNEILDPGIRLADGEWVIFCKKNAKDLSKLISKIGPIKGKIIIDDEADFATPNSKINSGDITKINRLVGRLLNGDGIYVGVTATPARLDLNNTFQNDSELWVDFPPHTKYTGQDVFFPVEEKIGYQLKVLPDSGDDPKYVREALLRFLVTAAFLNLYANSGTPQNYSMLIHTSGKKDDHVDDRRTIEKTFQIITNESDKKYEQYVEQIWNIAAEKFPGREDEITAYVLANASTYSIVVMNSARDKNTDFKSATSPASLFTIAIGGNIVSRGVTFDNLLSMFFTRDVKHKIQQDTYIQRARMFGARGGYLKHFELTIPEQLYLDWHRCFVFHKLALTSIREGKGSPVWLADKRVSVAAGASIDRTTVSMDSGEMAFGLFPYDKEIETIVESDAPVFDKLRRIQKLIGEASFPEFLIAYIARVCPDGEDSIALHESSSIEGYKDGDGVDKDKIERSRGFFGRNQMQREKFPKALHHLKVFFNGKGKGRLFYKFDGSIQFIKNLRN